MCFQNLATKALMSKRRGKTYREADRIMGFVVWNSFKFVSSKFYVFVDGLGRRFWAALATVASLLPERRID